MRTLLRKAAAQGLFPGGVCLWGDPAEEPRAAVGGLLGTSRDRRPVDESVVYDLASLTKIIAATSLMMILSADGRLDIEAPLAETPLNSADAPCPAAWRRVTVSDLLRHQAGLPPWRPFYKIKAATAAERKKRVLRAIFNERPLAPPKSRTVYSDLGFMLLGFLAEKICGGELGEIFHNLVALPLGLADLGFRPAAPNIAPTEDGFRVGGPLDYPGAHIFGPTPLGRVHDDNAAALGGAAGHAGLFGSARAVWAVAADWALALKSGRGRIFEGDTVRRFITPAPDGQGPGRPLGFNVKRLQVILDGSGFSENAVGHLGYTGTSLWWDVEKNFLWALLTNRVHPSARNQGINDFRRLMARRLTAAWNH